MGKYTSVTVTGYNANPPPDDGTTVSSNEIKWSNHKTKIGDPLKTAIEAVNTNITAAMAKTIGATVSSKSADYTVTTADEGDLIEFTVTAIATLPTASSAGSGFVVGFKNNSTSGTVTITPNGSETIDGASTLVLSSSQDVALIVSNGSAWKILANAITPTTQTRKNLLINGNFGTWQRGTSITSATTYANNDDSYTADRWVLLSEANNTVNVARDSAAPPTGSLYNLKCTVQTINKQWGFVQIIEQLNCQRIIGSSAMLSFYAKTDATAKIDNLRAAIISWNSTADTVTSDVVATWHGTGTSPALASNWTYENTPANLALTSSWQRFSLSAAIDTSGATNVAVFIWVDDNDAASSDLLYLSQIQLEPGTTLSGFEFRPIQEEVSLCQRYFNKTYSIDVTPGTATSVGAIYTYATLTSANAVMATVFWPVEMRIAPTMSIYSDTSGTVAKIHQDTTGTDKDAIGFNPSTRCGSIQNNAGLDAAQRLSAQAVADAEL